MQIDTWPKWLRWLLFLPAALLATSLTHFVISFIWVSNDDSFIQGPSIDWMAAVGREGLMRFFEPFMAVVAAGFVAPARKPAAAIVAAALILIFVVIFVHQLGNFEPADPNRDPRLYAFRAALGILGAISGAVWAMWQKSAAERGRVSSAPEAGPDGPL